ncbi:hypothetical protein BDQ17DRAFT_1351761 [Cyathus striatus]|nr:hypothetical protein BDQ17DRAFT_1351761 [Cyathus striatus]
MPRHVTNLYPLLTLTNFPPQGKVLYDVFLYTTKDSAGKPGYLLEYDGGPSEAPSLMSYLKRHVLRSKVRIRDLSEEYDAWAAWGSPADHSWETPRKWTRTGSGVVEPVWEANAEYPWGIEDHIIRDRPSDASTHDIVPPDSYHLHRILHGVPEGSEEIIPLHAFPMESNLDMMGGLDFRKGCYVGQELTVRTYHRGMVRKRIFPVVLKPADSIHDSAILPSRDIRPVATENQGADPILRPRGTGKLLTNQQGVGLALLRFEHVTGQERGALELQLVDNETCRSWSVLPWRPEWWPFPPGDIAEEY